MDRTWIDYFKEKGYAESEAESAQKELIEAANKTFEAAKGIAEISDFNTWCEIILAITDAFKLQQIQATSSAESAGEAMKTLSAKLQRLV